jgi:hypothetical protein
MQRTEYNMSTGETTVIQLTAEEIAALPSPKSLADTKLERIKYINQQADIAFNSITASYPKQEVSTWPNQYAEAWALQSDPAAYTPTLAAIALESNVTVTVLAGLVLQKAAAYTQASGLIVGKRKRLTDEINACLDNAEVGAITW